MSIKTLAMSSLEIAELTGKRHDNVVRDCGKMFDALTLNALKFEVVYLSEKNQQRKCYNLNKELTLTLVSGYDTKMRYTIVNRWQELEAKANGRDLLKRMTQKAHSQFESQDMSGYPRIYLGHFFDGNAIRNCRMIDFCKFTISSRYRIGGQLPRLD